MNENNLNELITQFNAQLTEYGQDLEATVGTAIFYAFSPIANITQLQNGNYLITITDRIGTTTAEVPTVTQENINYIITQYFEQNPVFENLIQTHNQSNTSHIDIRQSITNLSNIINNFNFKSFIKEYNTYYEFPNIPQEADKNKIFLDKSTGDLYLFGLNNSLAYTSIGFSNQDVIFGGDSTN